MFSLSKKATLFLLSLIVILYYLTRPKKKASELIQEVVDYSEYLEETIQQVKVSSKWNMHVCISLEYKVTHEYEYLNRSL